MVNNFKILDKDGYKLDVFELLEQRVSGTSLRELLTKDRYYHSLENHILPMLSEIKVKGYNDWDKTSLYLFALFHDAISNSDTVLYSLLTKGSWEEGELTLSQHNRRSIGRILPISDSWKFFSTREARESYKELHQKKYSKLDILNGLELIMEFHGDEREEVFRRYFQG